MAAAQARRNVLLILACAQFIIAINIAFMAVSRGTFMHDLYSTAPSIPSILAIYYFATRIIKLDDPTDRIQTARVGPAGISVVFFSPQTAPQADSAGIAASSMSKERRVAAART